MSSILYVGMDVHSTNYTLATFSLEYDAPKFIHTVEPDVKNILLYLEMVRCKTVGITGEVEFVCGYEAGCLGYTLYKELTERNIKCVIIAPTTMSVPRGKRIKTDKRDAALIAQCLAYRTYKAVYIPDEEDNSVKEYIRMRDDHNLELKRLKQQILSFCLRNGFHYTDGNYWTEKHLKYIREIRFENDILQEILAEYLTTYYSLTDKIARLDKRIDEFTELPKYKEKVERLNCFIGIKNRTSLGLLVEVGDFNRFGKASQYAAYLGLVPGEDSSSDNENKLSITKAGNSHVRRLMIESAQSFARGKVGFKSAELKQRQAGNSSEVIAYADKANERLRIKYYKFISRGMKRNVAITAIARELACFTWGMLTDHLC